MVHVVLRIRQLRWIGGCWLFLYMLFIFFAVRSDEYRDVPPKEANHHNNNVQEGIRVIVDYHEKHHHVQQEKGVSMSTPPPPRRLPVAAVAAVPFPTDTSESSNKNKNNNKKRRLELVHATKTGGTAMELSANQTGVRWGYEHYREHGSYGYQVTPPPSVSAKKYFGELWHTPPHWISPNILSSETNTNVDTFIVVRNPYTRYVSEYFCPWYPWSRTSTRSTRPDNPRQMNQWIQKFIHNMRHKEQHAHLLPFHYYIWDEQDNHKKKIRHILKYEDRLSERFQTLMNDYGLNNITLLAKFKSSSRSNSNVNYNARNTTALDLSDDTIRIINDYAQKDFQLLGYPMVSTAAELRVVLLAQ